MGDAKVGGDAPVGDGALSTDFVVRIEAALVKYLKTKPGQTELMNKVGLYLRARNLNPPESLKKFILSRPRKFTYSEDGDGHNRVTLVKETCLDSLPAEMAAPLNRTHSKVPTGIPKDLNPSLLDRHIVAYLAECKDHQASMASIGEMIIKTLGFSMKGHLHRYLTLRPQLFRVGDDFRNLVSLVDGAMATVGISELLPALPDDGDLLGDEIL